jgi:hypothetical protein
MQVKICKYNTFLTILKRITGKFIGHKMCTQFFSTKFKTVFISIKVLRGSPEVRAKTRVDLRDRVSVIFVRF